MLYDTLGRVASDIFDSNSFGGGILKIDIVHSCGGDTDEFEIGCSIHHLSGDDYFIGDHNIGILDSGWGLFCICCLMYNYITDVNQCTYIEVVTQCLCVKYYYFHHSLPIF